MRKRRLSRFQLDALVVIKINKIEISDHGQIDDPFVCMDIRNICHPFLVGSICVKVSVEKILILVHLLPHLYPLPWPADFSQDVILFHHSQHCFGVVVDPLLL